MTGTGGTVNLAADLTAEEGSRTGTITIAEADENSKIDVKLKDAKMERNLTSDDLTAEEAKALMAAGVEAAENVGVTSTVEEGMYNDGFRIDEEGATTSTGPNSVMQSTLELAAAAPLAINRILMNDVRKRLGDIRTSQGKLASGHAMTAVASRAPLALKTTSTRSRRASIRCRSALARR